MRPTIGPKMVEKSCQILVPFLDPFLEVWHRSEGGRPEFRAGTFAAEVPRGRLARAVEHYKIAGKQHEATRLEDLTRPGPRAGEFR